MATLPCRKYRQPRQKSFRLTFLLSFFVVFFVVALADDPEDDLVASSGWQYQAASLDLAQDRIAHNPLAHNRLAHESILLNDATIETAATEVARLMEDVRYCNNEYLYALHHYFCEKEQVEVDNGVRTENVCNRDIPGFDREKDCGCTTFADSYCEKRTIDTSICADLLEEESLNVEVMKREATLIETLRNGENDILKAQSDMLPTKTEKQSSEEKKQYQFLKSRFHEFAGKIFQDTVKASHEQLTNLQIFRNVTIKKVYKMANSVRTRQSVINEEELESHNQEYDCWVRINLDVFDITPWVATHPKTQIQYACGTDATTPWGEYHALDKFGPVLPSTRRVGTFSSFQGSQKAKSFVEKEKTTTVVTTTSARVPFSMSEGNDGANGRDNGTIKSDGTASQIQVLSTNVKAVPDRSQAPANQSNSSSNVSSTTNLMGTLLRREGTSGHGTADFGSQYHLAEVRKVAQ